MSEGSTLRNAKWLGASQAYRIAAQFFGVALLSRMLAPRDFGVIAMAAVFTNLAIMLRDLGTGAAVIQKQQLNEEVKTSVFWFNVAVGVLLFVGVVILSPVAAAFFGAPQIAPVLLCLAVVFPITSSATLHQALLERESNFKALAWVEVVAVSAGLMSALLSAALGAGAYSLVVQMLCQSSVSTVMLWRFSNWRPRSQPRWVELSGIGRFSGYLTAFNGVNYLCRNVDNLVIGRVLGAVSLGFYDMAYRIMLFPVQSFSAVAARALYPVLSRQQHCREEMAREYFVATKTVAMLTAPLMAGMWLIREPLVIVVLGHKWMRVADLLAWMAPAGFIQSLLSTSGAVYMATGRTKLLLQLGVLAALLFASAFLIGAYFGLVALTMAYFVANAINGLVSISLTMKQLGASLRAFGSALAPTVISTLMMAIPAYAAVNVSGGLVRKSAILEIAVAVGVAAPCYLLSMWALFGLTPARLWSGLFPKWSPVYRRR